MAEYAAAVIGGACAGSQIAHQLAEMGMDVYVFEQNALPYGKIEDGLPRWHAKLQNKEMSSIDEKLSHPRIHFAPHCKIGEDVSLEALRGEWGFPLIVMANGAWRDRTLRVDGLDKVNDDSFVYQNPFVHWFNHCHEANYRGKTYHVPPASVIIGGGLASIDVAKICQFEQLTRALRERGHEVDIIELEHYGIFKAAEKRGFTVDSLGVKPARLYYRKRVIDMPLVPMGENPPPQKLEKAKQVREKIIANACKRYGFEVIELRSPVEVKTDNGSVTSVVFQKNQYDGQRITRLDEFEEVPARLLISSIGSIPEGIEGVPMDGELYEWDNRFTGEVRDMPGVYCVGNAITGRGNIKDSFKNARRLGVLIENGLLENGEPDYEKLFEIQREEAKRCVERMVAYLKEMPAEDQSKRAARRERLAALYAARGYADYASWREKTLAAR